MQKITPHLWFDSQAEEAANFYVSLFEDSKINNVSHYPKAAEDVSGKPAGSVMSVSFELNGQNFLALNGGPIFKFSEATSFVINCKDQAEVDELWDKLTADGGEESQCGWLKDKYGLSWQVIPAGMGEIMGNPDPVKADRAMKAMLKMKKLDINELKRAAEEE
jgi:predicted 3-demethylubiquinone-9 3-methyltransferase (glyoxalase superfamily)